MKKVTTAQRNARIEAENKRFMKMSKPRRRVAIARDVLAQLGTKIIAYAGLYVESSELTNLEPSEQLQKHLKSLKKCEACALGSLFICAVTRANDITVEQAGVSYGAIDPPHKYLSRFFTKSQMALIEAAFEQSPSFAGKVSEKRREQAVAFVSEVPDAQGASYAQEELRLRLIMENIVANNGTFRPEIKPKVQVVTPGFKG